MMEDSSGLRIVIRVKGELDVDWSGWLGDLKIKHTANGITILSGPVPDQAALYGLLSRLSSLGLRLISVSSESANIAGRGKEDKI